MGGVLADLNESSKTFVELNRLNSDAERVAWVDRNYKNAIRISNSLFTKLLKVSVNQGLCEVVFVLKREVLEGDLLRDCLASGADDLKGLVQVLKDIALQYASSYPKTQLINNVQESRKFGA